ncbi:hypothetical protein [Plantibacter sp. T3]|uniref:hypothetical protein n=1 Tax=Plantibacter sp. T3 TaxID=2653161 RepID=UPI001357D5B0|nr:hypothetical protein [Plantibacter sp. T3]
MTLKRNPRQSVADRARRARPTAVTGGSAALGIIAIGLTLVSCSAEPAPAPEKLEPEYMVRDVQLDAELADTRMDVLEMCNTGDGAAEMRQAWTDYGFEERSGYSFMDAVKVSTDFTYIDETGAEKDLPNKAILYYGEYTYPTIKLLAENCNEVAWLASHSAFDVSLPESASKLLEEFRKPDIDYTPDTLQGLYNHVVPLLNEKADAP